jgi:hypothetical protein
MAGAGIIACTWPSGGRALAELPEPCPDFTVACTAEYDPVICDDGNIYPNLCVATYAGCAEGCESTGGGIIFLNGADATAGRLAGAYTPILIGNVPSAYMLVPIGGVGGGCPDFTVLCPAVYDPVICDDGNTYGNLCEATYWGCATGCVPTGGGVVEFSRVTGVAHGGITVQPLGGETTFLRRPGGGGGGGGSGCPRNDIVCTMEYDPVICDDGNIYSNLCVATYFGCATGCEPLYGDGGGIPLSTQSGGSGGTVTPTPTTDQSMSTVTVIPVQQAE